MKKRTPFVQQQLKRDGFRPGPADGILGPKTLGALNKAQGIDPKFSNKRKVIAYIQLTAQTNGIATGPIDGYWDPRQNLPLNHYNIWLKRVTNHKSGGLKIFSIKIPANGLCKTPRN